MLALNLGASDTGMSWLEWTSSVIGSLAWPVAAVVIALLFRNQIAGILTKFRRFTWGDKIFDFSDTLDRIETISESNEPVNENEPAPLPDERFQKLLAISPSAAVLDSWKPIELRLRELADRHMAGTIDVRTPTVHRIMDDLYRNGVISPTIYEIMRDLQRLRNAAAHQQEVSPTDAVRFQASAEKVMRALEKI